MVISNLKLCLKQVQFIIHHDFLCWLGCSADLTWACSCRLDGMDSAGKTGMAWSFFHVVFHLKFLHSIMFSRQHFKRVKQMLQGPLRLRLQNSNNITSPTTHWSKQVKKASLDSRIWRNRPHLYKGEAEKSHCKGGYILVWKEDI